MAVKTVNIDFKSASVFLDKIGNGNGTFAALLFLLNLGAFIIYVSIFVRLQGTTIDRSLVIIPELCVVLSYLVCSYQTHSARSNEYDDFIRMVMILFCAIILFGIIPLMGYEFDVFGISLDYWNFMGKVITGFFIYLTAFGVINLIVKACIEDDETHG